MRLIQISHHVLSSMQEILSLSAGYEVTLADELEYFNPNTAESWFLALGGEEQQLGFVRDLAQGPAWSLGELFVKPQAHNRKELAEKLLNQFQSAKTFKLGHRLRFDLLMSDSELNDVLQKSGFSQKRQTFLHFERGTENVPARRTPDNAEVTAAELAEILNHLHPVSESEAEQWIRNGTVRAISAGSRLAAAAQIYDFEDRIEVNRIATHPNFLRQGYGKKLVENILIEAKSNGRTHVYLKVEDIRLPAKLLYQNAGFIEVPEKAQCWHSRWY